MANDSNLATYVTLNNQPCMTRPIFIDLKQYEYIHVWVTIL